jgi:hypothetical protein
MRYKKLAVACCVGVGLTERLLLNILDKPARSPRKAQIVCITVHTYMRPRDCAPGSIRALHAEWPGSTAAGQ